METSFAVFCSIGLAVTLVLLRIIFMIFTILTSECKLISETKSLRTALCIGSGGHTTELLRLIKNFDTNKFKPRYYILADSDVSSEVKIHKQEFGHTDYGICKIPRSRNVQQSYLSSIFSTLHATLLTIPVVYNSKPNVIFCNGPGTCVPVCVVAFVLRCLFILDCRIVFVESVCRVRTLSLTGKILQYFADIMVVQWPQLRDICFRAKYFGRLT